MFKDNKYIFEYEVIGMLAMNHKRAAAAEIAKKYIKATKKEETKILDEFKNLTGYNRPDPRLFSFTFFLFFVKLRHKFLYMNRKC